MGKVLFVTGTGTDVGKTIVSAALVAGLRRLGRNPRYWKPVQTGAGPHDGDAARVIALTGEPGLLSPAPSFFFPLPASPDQAAAAAKAPAPTVDGILDRVPQDDDFLVVEGAGGLLVPLNHAGETWADLLERTGWPALIVASTGLGTINHTSLTLREAARRGIPVAGVILNGPPHDDNRITLGNLFPEIRFHHLAFHPLPDHDQPLGAEWHRPAEQLAEFALVGSNSTAPASDWEALDHRYVWHPYTQHQTAPPPLPIVGAAGARVFLAGGEALVDGHSSWWVNNIGHGRPEIGAAIQRQQNRLDHVIFAGATHEPAARLAARLVRAVNGGEEHRPDPINRVFYSDNGSTAVEVALKIVYQTWVHRGESDRTRFLAFRGSYHGDTFGTMAVAASDGFHGVFRPFLFEAEHADPVTSHRSAVCPEGSAGLAQRLAAIERTMADGSRPGASPRLAGVIIEPLVQGAGGMLMQPAEFLVALGALCRRYQLPLIFDEVMTGFGRLGAMFAFQRAGVEPDLICLAKGITGGNLPLAVTLARESFFRAFLSEDRGKALLHGHSYTANPIACAAGLAALDILERDRLSERALALEQRYRGFIDEHTGRLELQQPRTVGSILAFELPGTGAADYFHPRAAQLPALARARGLLLRPLGNTVYLMPPLAISDAELDQALAAITYAVEQLR